MTALEEKSSKAGKLALAIGLTASAVLGGAWILNDSLYRRDIYGADSENPNGRYVCSMEDNEQKISPTTSDVSCRYVAMIRKDFSARLVDPKHLYQNLKEERQK
jgi:hypothetical protein